MMENAIEFHNGTVRIGYYEGSYGDYNWTASSTWDLPNYNVNIGNLLFENATVIIQPGIELLGIPYTQLNIFQELGHMDECMEYKTYIYCHNSSGVNIDQLPGIAFTSKEQLFSVTIKPIDYAVISSDPNYVYIKANLVGDNKFILGGLGLKGYVVVYDYDKQSIGIRMYFLKQPYIQV